LSAVPLTLSDLASAAVSVCILVVYHLALHVKVRRDPTYTVQGTNERIRTLWVHGVMQQNKDILGVQTLRNSTMASTFLASTSVVLVLGILSQVAKVDPLASASGFKLLLVLFDLFVAFFGFAMSIRLYNHVGYMLGVQGVSELDRLEPAQVAWHLNRAAHYYSAGMRAFYFLVPLVFWFFGPWALLLATLGLVVFLFSNDRAPRD
jgi:uncharacterized membrane protein